MPGIFITVSMHFVVCTHNVHNFKHDIHFFFFFKFIDIHILKSEISNMYEQCENQYPIDNLFRYTSYVFFSPKLTY